MNQRNSVFPGAVCCLVLLAAAVNAQDAAVAASPQTTPAVSGTSSAAAQPAKKVWTNDDLGSAHEGGSASAANSHASAVHPTKAATSTSARGKPGNNFAAQITKLQAQLPPIDSQIADLQAALSGNTVNETRKYAGVKPDSWQAELDALQKKRADIQSQIEALENQARHSGVPANALP